MTERDADLQAYDDAWRNTDKALRNEVCQRLADDYVRAHPELRERYAGLTIPELVALVTIARQNGDETKRIQLDIWINAAYEYQQIGAAVSTDGTPREPLAPLNTSGDRRGLAE